MHTSANTLFKDLSLNILSNLFYEDSYLKLFSSLSKTKSESLPFLRLVIGTINEFLSVLGTYCRDRNGVTVRKKTKRRTGGDEEEDVQVSISEKTLSMDRIFVAFINESTIETYMRFLSLSHDSFHEADLLGVVRFLYKISVKFDMVGYLWRVELYLFYIIDQIDVVFDYVSSLVGVTAHDARHEGIASSHSTCVNASFCKDPRVSVITD
jgi:hypothetical protein